MLGLSHRVPFHCLGVHALSVASVSIRNAQVARRLIPGDVVAIPPGVEYWHGGAPPDSGFSHLAIECNPEINRNIWLEAVSDTDYLAAAK